jgi:multiple sugar transport system permease protein
MAKKSIGIRRTPGQKIFRVFAYILCIFLACLSLFPFIIMLVNATRDTPSIQSSPISFVFGSNLKRNFQILTSKDMFSPWVGLKNSLIISVCATALTVYFSTLTAYALVAYEWKLKGPFFAMILAVMMIPATITSIGFYQFMYRIGWTNNLLPLILPAIAAPGTVFFMRQFMIPALPMEIVQSARVDGASEFRTFNQIVLPIMKPAMATQAIFAFVASWNNLFIPQILLTKKEVYTMPIMVSLLNGDIYKVEYGAIYLGILLTVLPIFVIYFALSKYIIAGVALGGVKE